MASVKAGPAWILIEALDSSGSPTGDITNLQYNKEVKTTFKPKKYDVEPDNAPTAVESLPLGLETAQTTCNLISQAIDIYRIALGEPSGSLSGSVLDISGMALGEKFRVLVIYPDIVANAGTSIYKQIEDGGSLTVDVFEYRYADLGGEEVSRDATPESESTLPFIAKCLTATGLTAIPAKYEEGHTLEDASVLNSASPGSWPITLYTYS
jgi:hypothetical protein